MAEQTSGKRSFQPPKGTRDFYPQEMLVRRYITDAWRRVSLRHGFEEIDGPTFETAALYSVKSGEGILGEMFGTYSGKDPADVEAVREGRPPFALRPEFTPTLARMYASKAAQLPKPTKWFCVSNFFRAEKPQRGRLREFWQWNADVLGGEDSIGSDADVIECATALFADLGASPAELKVHLSSRSIVASILQYSGVPLDRIPEAMQLLDRTGKMEASAHELACAKIGLDSSKYDREVERFGRLFLRGTSGGEFLRSTGETGGFDFKPMFALRDALNNRGLDGWCEADMSIVRGLAYYTGTVFEVIAEGERAVAGGGRYDNLIELFGGPPTPACGFGMGDVVLANLLTDKGLMPEGRELLEAVARPMPVRPDVFVVAANDDAQAQVTPTVAALRRGVESAAYKDSLVSSDPAQRIKPWDEAKRYEVRPLHARRSYKSTKNVGKLLADAGACFARYAVIIENAEVCSVKNLDTREETKNVPLNDVGAHIAR